MMDMLLGWSEGHEVSSPVCSPMMLTAGALMPMYRPRAFNVSLSASRHLWWGHSLGSQSIL